MLQRLSMMWNTYTPIEASVLTAITEALPPESGELMRAQMAAITKVQRTLDWTEILFYSEKGGTVHWKEETLFPNRTEFELAAATYDIDGTHFRTSVGAIGGHIFDFVTRPSIKDLAFRDPENLLVLILSDPMMDPAKGSDLARFLPQSYLDYWKEGERAARMENGWEVLHPDSVYVVPFPKEDYLLLAEKEGREWLVVPAREGNSRIFYSVDGEQPQPVPGSFEGAVRASH
jgi:hypothetical protein